MTPVKIAAFLAAWARRKLTPTPVIVIVLPPASLGQHGLVAEARAARPAVPTIPAPPESIAALQPRREKLRASRKSTASIDRAMRAERKKIYERLFARPDEGATVP